MDFCTIMDIYRTDFHKCLPDAVPCPVRVAISMFLVVLPYHVTLSLVHVAVFATRRSVVGIPVCYGPTRTWSNLKQRELPHFSPISKCRLPASITYAPPSSRGQRPPDCRPIGERCSGSSHRSCAAGRAR